MKATDISEDSYRDARAVFEAIGLFEREDREPATPPQQAGAGRRVRLDVRTITVASRRPVG